MKSIMTGLIAFMFVFTGCDEHKERTTYYSNGNIKAVTHYLDGKKDGEEIQYSKYKNKKMTKKIMWAMGEKIGHIKYFHDINGDQEIRYGFYDKKE